MNPKANVSLDLFLQNWQALRLQSYPENYSGYKRISWPFFRTLTTIILIKYHVICLYACQIQHKCKHTTCRTKKLFQLKPLTDRKRKHSSSVSCTQDLTLATNMGGWKIAGSFNKGESQVFASNKPVRLTRTKISTFGKKWVYLLWHL